MDDGFNMQFFVVSNGKPSARSKRIWCPKTALVPVPVRSSRSTPSSRIRRNKLRYCCIIDPLIKILLVSTNHFCIATTASELLKLHGHRALCKLLSIETVWTKRKKHVLVSTLKLAKTASKSKLFFETSPNTTIFIVLVFQLWR